MEREFVLLRLRNAISNKEWYIASANRDLALYGNWSCDWPSCISDASIEIEKICTELCATQTPA